MSERETTVIQSQPGRQITYKPRGSDTTRNITIDREWDVYLGDTHIGFIRHGFADVHPIRPADHVTRQDGWNVIGWRWKTPTMEFWFSGRTKGDAVHRLLSRHLADAAAAIPRHVIES
ncbi:hypothetical protein [Aeromicrobium sp. 179-A 4D2 NHS]|uniref:hypothetical protein n=1 Tax=Aeromicrobium sp. 179-A 4D2 NHS TaxID=3142375 RepID=UPI0039A0AA41